MCSLGTDPDPTPPMDDRIDSRSKGMKDSIKRNQFMMDLRIQIRDESADLVAESRNPVARFRGIMFRLIADSRIQNLREEDSFQPTGMNELIIWGHGCR
ncbi:hypothetical protein AVEN_244014-1 [Araneus ventricosus]|uniref:Uncharacterized protein n=1 Tax=Araneus ventricosus TaxID=182803 RepID=A0A4Y2VJB6_ARAVE|nr:hypothetical protein AVEN_244014-1 [Araneus ventricosus]